MDVPDAARIGFRPPFDVRVLDERRVLLLSEDRTVPLTGKPCVALGPAARVIVPGPRHFLAPPGAGTALRRAAALGRVERPLAEAELNPVPLPV
jgi:hypothetical protein